MRHSQKLKEWERRRRRAGRALERGESQAQVARDAGVSRQSAMRWARRLEAGGSEALRRPRRFGRPEKLSIEQRAELVKLLKAGALAAGFATELWSTPRIGELIRERFGVNLTQPSVWRLLGRLGWSVQRPTGQARERDEKAIRTWKEKRWPQIKKSRRDKAEPSSL